MVVIVTQTSSKMLSMVFLIRRMTRSQNKQKLSAAKQPSTGRLMTIRMTLGTRRLTRTEAFHWMMLWWLANTGTLARTLSSSWVVRSSQGSLTLGPYRSPSTACLTSLSSTWSDRWQFMLPSTWQGLLYRLILSREWSLSWLHRSVSYTPAMSSTNHSTPSLAKPSKARWLMEPRCISSRSAIIHLFRTSMLKAPTICITGLATRSSRHVSTWTLSIW